MFEFQSLTRQREDTGHVFLVDVRLHTENGHVVFRDALLAVIDDIFFAHVQGGRAGEEEDVRVQKRDGAHGGGLHQRHDILAVNHARDGLDFL